MKWEDLKLEDINNATLTVNKSLVEYQDADTGATKIEFHEPKTAKSKRTIPLIPSVVNELKGHKARQAQEKLFLGSSYNNEGLVFCTEDGKRLYPSNFSRTYRRILTNAELPYKKLHSLRHTFVSLLAESGEDIKTIQELVGHAKISTTADIYTHVFEKTKRKAVNNLENILRVDPKK